MEKGKFLDQQGVVEAILYGVRGGCSLVPSQAVGWCLPGQWPQGAEQLRPELPASLMANQPHQMP